MVRGLLGEAAILIVLGLLVVLVVVGHAADGLNRHHREGLVGGLVAADAAVAGDFGSNVKCAQAQNNRSNKDGREDGLKKNNVSGHIHK